MLLELLRGNINLVGAVLNLMAIIVALTVHEFAHGYAAYLIGDTTAKRDGRLSLDPRRHIDPIGMVMMLVIGFGWAKPVMVSPYRFRNPKMGMAITAAAGPLSNFIFAFIARFAFEIFWNFAHPTNTAMVYFVIFLRILSSINIMLGVFNLLPIPPLDGSKVFGAFLHYEHYFRFINFPFGMPILFAIILAGGLGFILAPIVGAIDNGIEHVVYGILSIFT